MYTDTEDYKMQTDDTGVLYRTDAKMSFFGGTSDPMDDGSTASGFSTKDHPDFPYVALPGPVRRRYGMPWGCRVTIENSQGEQAHGRLVDTGPAEQTGRQIDLSPLFNTELGIQTDDLVKFYVKIADVIPVGEWPAKRAAGEDN